MNPEMNESSEQQHHDGLYGRFRLLSRRQQHNQTQSSDDDLFYARATAGNVRPQTQHRQKEWRSAIIDEPKHERFTSNHKLPTYTGNDTVQAKKLYRPISALSSRFAANAANVANVDNAANAEDQKMSWRKSNDEDKDENWRRPSDKDDSSNKSEDDWSFLRKKTTQTNVNRISSIPHFRSVYLTPQDESVLKQIALFLFQHSDDIEEKDYEDYMSVLKKCLVDNQSSE